MINAAQDIALLISVWPILFVAGLIMKRLLNLQGEAGMYDYRPKIILIEKER